MNAPIPDGMERLLEVRTKVEAAKARVRNLQESVRAAKETAEGQWPRQAGTWRIYQETKKEWSRAINDLSAVKLELSRLSGTTGHDPRWRLLAEAWHVLSEMEERGIELGERAEALIEDIEFHVPIAKLESVARSPVPDTGTKT